MSDSGDGPRQKRAHSSPGQHMKSGLDSWILPKVILMATQQRSTPVYEVDVQGNVYTEIPGYEWVKVNAWTTSQDGSRQRSDQQERNENGEGLWSRYAYVNRIQYGNAIPEMVELRLWSLHDPNLLSLLPGEDDWEGGDDE